MRLVDVARQVALPHDALSTESGRSVPLPRSVVQSVTVYMKSTDTAGALVNHRLLITNIITELEMRATHVASVSSKSNGIMWAPNAT